MLKAPFQDLVSGVRAVDTMTASVISFSNKFFCFLIAVWRNLQAALKPLFAGASADLPRFAQHQ
jgi:hypothetical protein